MVSYLGFTSAGSEGSVEDTVLPFVWIIDGFQTYVLFIFK